MAFRVVNGEIVCDTYAEALEMQRGGGGSVASNGASNGHAEPEAPKKAKAKRAAASGESSVTSEAILAELRKEPGQRLETLSVALGVESKELKKIVPSMLTEGLIRKTGERRGTKYFAKTA